MNACICFGYRLDVTADQPWFNPSTESFEYWWKNTTDDHGMTPEQKFSGTLDFYKSQKIVVRETPNDCPFEIIVSGNGEQFLALKKFTRRTTNGDTRIIPILGMIDKDKAGNFYNLLQDFTFVFSIKTIGLVELRLVDENKKVS